MDSAKLNDWLQVIGVFGVIASLIFVGLQLKQSQEIALASQYHARAAVTMDLNVALLESGFDWGIFNRPQSGYSPSERNALLSVMAWAWTAQENAHYQHEAGFLSDEAWEAMKIRLTEPLFSQGIGRGYFERRKLSFRSSFATFVEDLWQEAGASRETVGGNNP